MSLHTRKIGTHDVSEIGFGLMGLSITSGTIPTDENRFKVLDAAFEEGCTFWDTADLYGDNEELVGKWFKRTGKRDKIFLATKFGFIHGALFVVDGRPEYVKSAAERSMKNLGVDVIDLYYLHRADPKIPIEKTVSAMAELVKEGKVRYLGLSEVSADTLRRAHAVHPIAAIQVEYSPFCIQIESEKISLVKACRELGVTIVAYSPLGHGMLTGTYKSYDNIPADDSRQILPQLSRENFPKVLKLVDGIKEVAKRCDVTPGQVALAWLLAQGKDVIPIPGTKNIKYLKENLGAAKVKLSDKDLEAVRELAEEASATFGPRYLTGLLELSFNDTPPLEL